MVVVLALGMLVDWVITQMDELVSQNIWVVFLSWKTNITLVVEPDGQGIPVRHQYPLSDIEFPIMNYERIFYVFLNHPLLLLVPRVAHYFVQTIEHLNASSARQTSWLQHPHVPVSIEHKLWEFLLHPFQHLSYFLYQRVLHFLFLLRRLSTELSLICC